MFGVNFQNPFYLNYFKMGVWNIGLYSWLTLQDEYSEEEEEGHLNEILNVLKGCARIPSIG